MTILELKMGGLPFPHGGQGGEWRPPAVRFYFGWQALAADPGARFDGVHPVKILGGLRLDDPLIAVVVHASQRHLITVGAGRFRDRVAFVDIDPAGPQDWAVRGVHGGPATGLTALFRAGRGPLMPTVPAGPVPEIPGMGTAAWGVSRRGERRSARRPASG
jgi:hypothetical protein